MFARDYRKLVDVRFVGGAQLHVGDNGGGFVAYVHFAPADFHNPLFAVAEEFAGELPPLRVGFRAAD